MSWTTVVGELQKSNMFKYKFEMHALVLLDWGVDGHVVYFSGLVFLWLSRRFSQCYLSFIWEIISKKTVKFLNPLKYFITSSSVTGA